MDNGATAAFYQMSAAPRDRLFAITDLGLIYSDDAACGWSKAQGMLAGKSPQDYFPDAANPNRVWAVRPPDAAGGSYTVVESLDGGTTFTTVRFTAVPGDAITGLEIALATSTSASSPSIQATRTSCCCACRRCRATAWRCRSTAGRRSSRPIP